MDSRGWPGGSIRLLELVREYEAEIAYDFRNKFGLSIEELGNSYTLREAVLLVSVLVTVPDSYLAAAKQRWQFPVSRDWTLLASLFDLTVAANSKKGKAQKYPRPWASGKRVGRAMDRDEAIKRLDAMNKRESE